MENMIFLELRHRYPKLYYFKKGNEIDFYEFDTEQLIQMIWKLNGVETHQRGTRLFLDLKKGKRSILVSMQSYPHRRESLSFKFQEAMVFYSKFNCWFLLTIGLSQTLEYFKKIKFYLTK